MSHLPAGWPGSFAEATWKFYVSDKLLIQTSVSLFTRGKNDHTWQGHYEGQYALSVPCAGNKGIYEKS